MNILITGGSSGVGLEVLRSLSQGNRIWFTFTKSAEKASALEKEIEGSVAVQCDFQDQGSVDSLCERIPGMDLDLLVNNAWSDNQLMQFVKMPMPYVLENFQANVLSTVKITQKALQGFKKKKQGRIINILTSFLVNTPPLGASVYTANKAYLQSMSKSWAVEHAKFNITSNSISPAFMVTGFTKDTDERIIEALANEEPLGRLLDPAEVAEAVKFLSTAPLHINGINMIINSAKNVL